MKKRSIQQVFVAFLKSEGVFEAYRDNWMRSIAIIDRDLYVRTAFTWMLTYEGTEFWKNINQKWFKVLDKIKETNPVYYHTRCNDCGRFVKRERWPLKTESGFPLCEYCASCYDVAY